LPRCGAERTEARIPDIEDRDWQRLDKWLWCARVMRTRSDCAALVAEGLIRLNRQPTAKPHARLRVGDVLTIPIRNQVRVLRVLQLAVRRGPAAEARLLYLDLDEVSAIPCAEGESAPYPEP
jgi:ribosome-associated heat shock protein Hsp15